MRVFVTGGAGYIGSHTLLQLLNAGHHCLVYDNFSNSSPIALRRVADLATRKFETIEGNIVDKNCLMTALQKFQPDVVIHFAGLKSVSESSAFPLKYYNENVGGTINLLEVMESIGCDKIVFSSSATVYGPAKYLPFDEHHPLQPTNPYGRTKSFCEQIIEDWVATGKKKSAILLRYFNPVGAHSSGLIGEQPKGTPNNLMPYVTQVAAGRLERIAIFGNDYETRDGTGERDYIHVEDLARAHLAAISYCITATGCEAFNVGTGYGVTVLELINAFKSVSGQSVPYVIAPRRLGDVARSIATPCKANRALHWKAELGINEMCISAWTWQKNNPDGYTES